MRPSVSEQLDGLRRILSDIIAPEVTAAYPAEILRGVIGALDGLQSAWTAIPEFLRWDIAATEAVLRTALPVVDGDLAAEIVAAQSAEALDWAALEERQMLLRALLVRAVPAIAGARDRNGAYAMMIQLFRERAERYPFSMAPRPAAGKDS